EVFDPEEIVVGVSPARLEQQVVIAPQDGVLFFEGVHSRLQLRICQRPARPRRLLCGKRHGEQRRGASSDNEAAAFHLDPASSNTRKSYRQDRMFGGGSGRRPLQYLKKAFLPMILMESFRDGSLHSNGQHLGALK